MNSKKFSSAEHNEKNELDFHVDKVSGSLFYNNLLLGLPRNLEKMSNIHKRRLKKFQPASKLQIKIWETAHEVFLPQDIRDFYLSTNGLLYKYTFSYDPTVREKISTVKTLAKIEINTIEKLTLIKDYEVKEISKIYQYGYIFKLDLSPESKIFELCNKGWYKIVLVYVDSKTIPSLWIYYVKTFYFIAPDLTTYLRMAITHLGVPGWEFAFTPLGLPGKTKEMLNIIAPGVLYENRSLIYEEHNDDFINKLDSDIFNRCELNTSSSNTNQSVNKASVSTIDKKPSVPVISKNRLNVSRRASSPLSSRSEKVKKKSVHKRRPFTPVF